MAVPRFGTWHTKWGMMTSLKGCFRLPLKFQYWCCCWFRPKRHTQWSSKI